MSTDGSTDRRRWAGGLVALLGGLLTAGQLRPLPRIEEPLALLLTVVVPVLFGLVLVGVGLATARGTLVDEADAAWFAGWVVAGVVIFLLTGLWVLVLDFALGYAIPYGLVLTLDAVSLGGVVGAVIGLYDVRNREYTRRLRARERRLEEQNERLDEFASMVSHDLRNPLEVATIRVAAAREATDDEHLASAAAALDRMEALIDDLLTLAREGESVTDPDAVDLRAVAERTYRTVDTKGATLVTETDRRLLADETRLQELLENLFRNAVEHGSTSSRTESGDAVEHGGPDVTITVGDLPDGFYVADDGPGIPEDDRALVFESGYSTASGGTGFGLSIVERLASAHGWEVRVTDGDDGGARFEITGVDRPRD